MEQSDIDILVQMKQNIERFNASICSIGDKKIHLYNQTSKKMNIVNIYNSYFNDDYIKQTKKDVDFLIKSITEVLKEECDHQIEEDYIDVYPDKSLKIHYCVKCLLTL